MVLSENVQKVIHNVEGHAQYEEVKNLCLAFEPDREFETEEAEFYRHIFRTGPANMYTDWRPVAWPHDGPLAPSVLREYAIVFVFVFPVHGVTLVLRNTLGRIHNLYG